MAKLFVHGGQCGKETVITARKSSPTECALEFESTWRIRRFPRPARREPSPTWAREKQNLLIRPGEVRTGCSTGCSSWSTSWSTTCST